MTLIRLAILAAATAMIGGTAYAQSADPLAITSFHPPIGERSSSEVWTVEAMAAAQPAELPSVDPALVRAAAGRARTALDGVFGETPSVNIGQ